LLFKGSGFYTTDYRSENYKAGAKKDAAAQTPAKSEAKPAPPTAATPGKSAGSDAAGKTGGPAPATPAKGRENS